MSSMVDRYRAADYPLDYHGEAEVPSALHSLLEALAEEVDALKEAAQRPAAESSGMSRADALKEAREHVEAISTNSRGYQDGVKLSDKVQAIDRFARFLMGESE